LTDLGVRRQRHERRIRRARQNVGELRLTQKAETYDRRSERLSRDTFGQRFLYLLACHDSAAQEQLDDAPAFGPERRELLTSGDRGGGRAQRTEKLCRWRVFGNKRGRAGGEGKIAHPWVAGEEHD